MNTKHLIRLIAVVLCLVTVIGLCAEALAAYRTIPYGEKSNDVRRLQDALKKKGYYKGKVDGEFGPATKKAVMKYQTAIGIHADGRPGNKTLTALYEGRSKLNATKNSQLLAQSTTLDSHSLSYGCTGYRVKQLQSSLRAAGVYKGAIDGVYGDLTYAAVRKYQAKKGLHVDGIAGKKTIASLNKNTKLKISTSFLLDDGYAGDEVKAISAYLTRNGYMSGVTRNYDSTVKDAVKAWQADKGKDVTGQISETQYNRIVLGKEDPVTTP